MSVDLNSVLNEKLNLEPTDLTSPDIVIQEIANQISTYTKGSVKAVVEEYNGRIESYTTKSGLAAFTALAESVSVVEHDVQDQLGEIGANRTNYELYFAADSLPNYRFRVLFFGFGIGQYPVKLVVEQAIAKALNKQGYTFYAKNRTELENIVLSILSASKTIDILQELVYAVQIAKEKDLSAVVEIASREEN